MDWKDTLGSLLAAGDLPEGDAGDVAEETTSEPQKAGKGFALHVLKERKGRAGKTATIIDGFEGSDEDLRELAATLKHRLGVGGSARGGEILIQGDMVEKVKALLRTLGYKVKG